MLGKKYRIKDNLNNIANSSSKDNSKTKGSASGDKLYVTRKGNVKVFDSNKERVTYFCEHSDLVNKAIDFNENYEKFFGKNVIIECNSDKIIGEKIDLDFPSVGATENAILASCLATRKNNYN